MWALVRDRNFVVYVAFLAILLFFAIALRDTGFLTTTNLLNIVRQTAPIAVMAVGMTYALSAGEIDLSIGSVVALSALVGALVIADVGPLAGVAAGLGVGLAVGLVNGLLTAKVRIPSFLVTLGMMGIVAGLARWITDLQSVPVREEVFTFVFGSGSIGPISTLILWAVVIVLIGHLAYRHTRFGKHVLATGGNRAAANYVGINTARIKIAVLVLSSSSAALAGLLYAGRLHGARYTLGEADLLIVIAAVIIGGTSLFGGRGTIVGAAVGALIMGMLNNGLILMGLNVAEQMVARGALIILAVALSMRELKE
jgi:ribose transport system permease protein